MARKKINTELWKALQPLLPTVEPSPKGGRPRVDGRASLNGILFVLQADIPWDDLPQELGFGNGMTCWRRLRDWQAGGVWGRLPRALLTRLREHDPSMAQRWQAARGGASRLARTPRTGANRQQTPSRCRPAQCALGAGCDRCQSLRFGCLRRLDQCNTRRACRVRPVTGRCSPWTRTPQGTTLWSCGTGTRPPTGRCRPVSVIR